MIGRGDSVSVQAFLGILTDHRTPYLCRQISQKEPLGDVNTDIDTSGTLKQQDSFSAV